MLFTCIAGDVAAFPLKMYGNKVMRQEHVTHCRTSAAHAVGALFGDTAPYDYLPFFYSRIFNLSWVFYGQNEGKAVVFGHPTPEAPKFGCYWVNEGKVVGAFLESGSTEENHYMKQVALQRPAVAEAEVAKLNELNAALALSQLKV